MLEASIVAIATDETLVQLARAGDRSAQGDLFRRHWWDAYRVAYRLLGNDQDAQDATQEAIIKALVHLADFDERSGFRTWLFRIVTNAAFDAGRRRKRRATVALVTSEGGSNPLEPAVEDDPTLSLRRQDLRTSLDAALAKIPYKNRETFILFAEAGFTYAEIAQVQKIPIGTVMSRISNARAKLQIYLENVEGL